MVTFFHLATNIHTAHVHLSFKNQGLTTVPVSNINPSTTHLDLQDNPLGIIPGGTFQGLGLVNMHLVNLAKTSLTDAGLNDSSFVGLETTKEVYRSFQ